RHNEVRVTHRHAQAHREMSVTVDNPQTESRDPLILDKFVSRNTEPPLLAVLWRPLWWVRAVIQFREI
ncbi:MAG: hypothetical protein QF828_06755, partial [Pseudomonadales bacterium]|nr:hypothetical protein [Pseudomonadales bacterium]